MEMMDFSTGYCVITKWYYMPRQ